ncbi:MFS transporter [Leucobacter albus]|uniref:MFS transporter n=1 Tax=Leucobacter albus TaxID=272210 RepID=A0ABW3TP44_9MICO
MTSSAIEPIPTRPWPAIAATAFAFSVTMMGTTLPTPLYSIYSDELAFSPLTVTVLFAVYALGVVGALSLFGRLSDDLGRRPVLMLAVGFALVSAFLFLLPPSLPQLTVARVASGIGAGFMSGAGTAAMMDLFPPERRGLAGTLAVAANTGGLAVGTLIAGLIAEQAARPLFTPFAVHLALCALALVGLLVWTPAPMGAGRFVIRPSRLRVPAELRHPFARAVLAAGSGFAATGVLTAVSALFLARDLGMGSHALAGFVVFLAFAGMAIGQLVARRMQASVALPLGCGGLVVGVALLALALHGVALAPLLAAATTVGVSAGLCLNAGLATTVQRALPERRGEVSSSFFAGLYTMLALPAIGVGLLATSIGLRGAGLVFTAAVALLAIAVATIDIVTNRRGEARA